MDLSSEFSDDSESESESGSSSYGSIFSRPSPERPYMQASFIHGFASASSVHKMGSNSKKPSKPLNILQKLYNRETRGNFSAHSHDPNLRLFDKIPQANRIRLRDILPESALRKGHICMGLSKCGQFLLTYTHTNDIDDIMLSNVHKYRLHWWLFVPHLQARKVAEVMLFGNQDVYCDLHISVCQWPTDSNKLLVYGHCHRLEDCQFGHAHMTITTVPSLSKCQDCLKVAASYEEDDLAAVWDSCVRFSCLKHGLTIHSNFDVVSPYPKFDAHVSMKRDGVVLFNTGNFLHVLRAELENVGAPPVPTGKRTDKPSTVAGSANNLETFNHTDEERAALFRNLNTESNRVETDSRMGAYLDNCNAHNSTNSLPRMLSDPAASNLLSGLVNVNKDCQSGNVVRTSTGYTESVEDGFWANVRELKGNLSEGSSNDASFRSCETSVDVSSTETKDGLVASLGMCLKEESTDAEQILGELNEIGERKRAKLDREYEENTEISSTDTSDMTEDTDTESGMFSPAGKRAKLEGCDCDAGKKTPAYMDFDQELNIMCLSPCFVPDVAPAVVPAPDCSECGRRRTAEVGRSAAERKPRKSRGAVKLSSPSTQPAAPLRATEVYEFTEEASDDCEKLSMYRRRRLAEKKYEFCEEGEDAENIVPYRIHKNIKGASPWICSPAPHLPPSPMVASHRRKHHEEVADPAASPRSPNLSVDVSEQDKVLRPFNRNNVTGICLLSPRDSEKDWAKHGVKKPATPAGAPDVATLKAVKEEAVPASQQAANAAATHMTQYNRRYVEVDDELVSVITDIEDDECGGSPAYQFALPVSVHGAGYAQLQMISNSKAEKLMAPGVVVRQMSFDVESFCHETSARLCEEAGKKYSFCTDYDVEIMDVCPFTCEVVVVAAMRILTQNTTDQTSVKSACKGQHTRVANPQREQFQGECTFVWNTETGCTSIVRTSPLQPAGKFNPGGPFSAETEKPWGPARGLVLALRKTQAACPVYRPVRTVSNETVFREKSYKCLVDLENLIEITL